MSEQRELFELPGGVPWPRDLPAPEGAEDLRGAARQYATTALHALVDVAARSRSGMARVAAADKILRLAYPDAGKGDDDGDSIDGFETVQYPDE